MKTASSTHKSPARRKAQSAPCRHLVVATVLLAALILSACGSPTPVDQNQDRSPLPTNLPPTITETTVPAAQSPLPTATVVPQPTASTPPQPTPTRIMLAPASTLEPATVIAVPTIPPLPTPSDLGMQKLIEQAKEDLAQRLDIDEGQIDLVKFEVVIWPDKGYGCPKPGIEYPQVPQDGIFIQLRAGKRVYDYHWGSGGPPFLCEK